MDDNATSGRHLSRGPCFARDFGDWDRLRAVFHPDGVMTSTRFTGPAGAFIANAAKNRTSRSTHFMGGTSVRPNGDRAFAESRMKHSVTL